MTTRAERRRFARLVQKAKLNADDMQVVAVWAAEIDQVPQAGKTAVDVLNSIMDDDRAGPMRLAQWTGRNAQERLRVICEMTTDERLLDAYNEMETALVEQGGYLLVAMADRIPQSVTPAL